jgi:hypothetical protein
VQLSGTVMSRFERSFQRLATGSTKSVEVAGGVDSTATGRNDGDSNSSSRVFSVANAAGCLKEWVNVALENYGSAMRVRSLGTELSDARVFAQLLAVLGAPPLPAVDTDHERCTLVISQARMLGIDCGLTDSQLRQGRESTNIILLAAMLRRYALMDAPKTTSNQPFLSFSDAASAMTNEALIAMMTRFEQLQTELASNRRWVDISSAIANTASALVLTEKDVSDAADAALQLIRQRVAMVSSDALKAAMPAPLLASLATAHATSQETASAALELALSAMTADLSSVLTTSAEGLVQCLQHYATFSSTDSNRPMVLDIGAWLRWNTDAKIVPKVVSKAACEGVAKGLPSQCVTPASLPACLLKMFFLKGASSDGTSATANDIVEQFRGVVVDFVNAPSTLRTSLDPFASLTLSKEVQDCFRGYRDPIRRIFNELALKESTPGAQPRLRSTVFVSLAVELKVLEATDAARLFAAVRIALESVDNSTVAADDSDSPVAPAGAQGVGLPGFQGLVFALSLTKYGGFPLASPTACIKSFLTSVLFPEFQHKLKLRW